MPHSPCAGRITIRNFTITGGPGGGYLGQSGGSNAVITQNHIYAMGGNRITVNQLSFAVIRNNNIHDNAGMESRSDETSDSRIRFDQNYDTAASPNTIQTAGGPGITVLGVIKARIVGNTITGNVGDGIGSSGTLRRTYRAIPSTTTAEAESAWVFNGGVQLRRGQPSTFFDQPNLSPCQEL
ncbi:MAG: right-handed parallel beta-helix repeat-containing protein [Betaproteobacteria bacterium]|nr:right-handed parallel beta-helix repeat-containing protein [Betaproteobacteria bacterium]